MLVVRTFDFKNSQITCTIWSRATQAFVILKDETNTDRSDTFHII